MRVATHSNWIIIMTPKNPKIVVGPKLLAKKGNTLAMIAANIQWVKLPMDCPYALSSLGKISAMNTQMTLPWPTAWEAININTKKGRKCEGIWPPEKE